VRFVVFVLEDTSTSPSAGYNNESDMDMDMQRHASTYSTVSRFF
jgi:hypothetical protein